MKKQQSGRSMVEMLGVLAIIGVLSIGGIAGYSMSMRKHRANQVADALSKYGFLIYNSCQKAIIDGDITGITSCNILDERIPSYADTGLTPVADLKSINFSKFDKNEKGELFLVLHASFYDSELCKATSSITGYSSRGDCYNTEDPWYATEFMFE